MADGVVQLMLKALDLPPHTSMIQMGNEGAALSVSVLPAEPPVTISVTASMDGMLMVTVQADTGEPRSDSNLLRLERRPPETMPAETQGSKEMLAEKETQQAGEDVMQEEEPAKRKAKKQKKESARKKTTRAAKKAQRLGLSGEGSDTPLPEPVASGSGMVMGEVALMDKEAAQQAKTTAAAVSKEPSKPVSPLPFDDKELEEVPAEMPGLETEQEVAAALQRNQLAPRV